MSNMPYCRFENTLWDFKDCVNALEGDGLGDLSEAEARSAKRIFELCELYQSNYKEATS